VKAAEKVTAVYVDCEWGQQHRDLRDKYGVSGYPTVVFADPQGNGSGDPLVGALPAEEYLSRLLQLADRFGKPAFHPTWEKAVEQAKKEKKAVLYFFETRSGKSQRLEAALMDPSNASVRTKFVLAKSEIKKDAADAARFRVANSEDPVIVVLDPRAEKPEEKQFRLPADARTPKPIREWLEKVIEVLERIE